MAYLTALSFRLAAGAAQLPEDRLRRHAAYLAGIQNADGGFPGRTGPSDLYYTGFALRGLILTGGLTEEITGRAAVFLERHLSRPLPSIDFLSLVSSTVLIEAASGIDVFQRAGCQREQEVASRTRPFRRDDGGYAKTLQSGASSTYHTFLVAACMDLIGAAIEDNSRMADLMRSRRRPDGGFVELPRLEHSGTNPTAAAVGLLRLLDALDDAVRQDAAAFLASMQNPEGGLRANTRIPVADLLSTFTGLIALADLECLGLFNIAAARRYVEALERPGGGFLGGSWDNGADAEYTFYGLGTLALLNTAP